MFNYSLLLASVLLVISAIAGASTGLAIPHGLEKRIFGGFIVPDTIVPYIVSLSSSNGKGVLSKCGGTLISPNHIVTAAHCVISHSSVVYPPQNITIGYNSTDVNDQDFTKATKVMLYPGAYVNGTLNMDLDIALLEFPGFKPSVSASRVSIYDGELEDGQVMLSLGWGLAESTVADRSELRGILTTVSSAKVCNDNTGSKLVDGGSAICALGKNNVGTCIMSGDSGTGAVINDNGRVKITAINSQTSVTNGGKGCEDGTLNAFYVRVGYFLDFIAEKTGYSRDYLTGKANK
ncbi:hypothetical protein LPJ56_000777 [Coemansia sp. RSA 2599]|nr:hypothetical protein LPJ75_000409 [Coemansia sp. RSA 2598]KAJ1828920.1 hypothetical protein LPJ56_000777 [Coemansia sp. RSA 2599]